MKLPKTLKVNVVGNSSTATKFENAKTITITDGENNGIETNFDGSQNILLNLPSKIKASLSGNADTVSKLQTARKFKISDGENNGTEINFDGTENISLKLPTTIKLNSTATPKLQLAQILPLLQINFQMFARFKQI